MMSATVINDPMLVTVSTMKSVSETEIQFANCDCCGLTEECTQNYIDRIRDRYQGKWICGLCAEAVEDEIVRTERLISREEALTRHINFCKNFNSIGPPSDPTVHLIEAMRQILRRSLESPRSTPNSPINNNSGIPSPSLSDSLAFDESK